MHSSNWETWFNIGNREVMIRIEDGRIIGVISNNAGKELTTSVIDKEELKTFAKDILNLLEE